MTIDKECIKAEVQNLGFSLAGFTAVDPLPGFEIFEDWIRAGRYAGMNYLARADTIAKRSNPRKLMPEARSVIVLAAAYPASQNSKHNTPGIASYAQLGQDYHQVFRDTCRKAIDVIRHVVPAAGKEPATFKTFSDTAPILEKEMAVRAGLGWIGKNGCLTNPHYGSWLLLAEIFTSLEIEPDEPFQRQHCGNCQRCLEACPTSCILPDRTLDAARCISYLTIEHRTDIPEPLHSPIGQQVFGCDICQQVCPWNRKAQEDPGSLFTRLPQCTTPLTLAKALEIDEKTFQDMFRDSPIMRAGWEGWLRNNLVAAGNSKDKTLLPIIVNILAGHPSPMVRRHAAWAISHLDPASSRSMLHDILQTEEDESVQQIINTIMEISGFE
ncbi:MAG TPA: tRNA epoxyqueuosine(34) reductase QueG [Anaerolineaceae bacterium]|nr:tRNA epoxyqueuosine(34) reductase QueG [Anaerolineaceae bacterium]